MSTFDAVTALMTSASQQEPELREFWKTAEQQGALPFGIRGKLNTVIVDTAYLLGLVALSADQRQAALTYLVGGSGNVSLEHVGRHNIIGTARNLLRAVDNLAKKGVDEQAGRIRGLASEANDILTVLLAERGRLTGDDDVSEVHTNAVLD